MGSKYNFSGPTVPFLAIYSTVYTGSTMTILRYHFTWQPPSISTIATLVIVSALVLQGCAAPTPAARQLQTEAMRGNVHIVKIEVIEQLPRIALELPSKGPASGAGRKAGKWAWNWAKASILVAGSGGGHPITLIATGVIGGGMLALTPVVSAAGAVKGAIEAPSAESVESSEAQVRGILQAEDLLHRVREQVIKEVVDKTSIIVAGRLQARDTIAAHEGAVSHTEGLQSDSVLGIWLTSLELRGPDEVDPELALHLEAIVTLVTPHLEPFLTLVTPPARRSSYTFRYVTRALRLSEWVENDAKLFTEAVNLSLARLAELIVDDLFLTYYFIHEPSDERERINYKN